MAVRSKAGGKLAARRRKGPPKRGNRAKGRSRRAPSVGRETRVERLTRELNEALEQQTATEDVLRAIVGSAGDLEPVFAGMLENAVRICGASFGIIHSWDGEVLCLLATHNLPAALDKARKSAPAFRPGSKTGIRRMAVTRSVVHIADLLIDESYLEEPTPQIVATAEIGGVRTMLAVPLLRENEVVGAFTLYRQEVRPFTDKQIALVRNFAAQAVIAIENARLLNEQRAALERQTASAEILRTIASTPGDAERALRQIAETTERLFGASSVSIRIADGDAWGQTIHVGSGAQRIVAAVPTAMIKVSGQNLPGTVVRDNRQIHIPDLDNPGSATTDWPGLPHARAAGTRTMAGTPLRREGQAIGALIVHRSQLTPFTAEELALQQSFADQAVIAIENARLLNELRQRTSDLTESLEQQTAITEILRVISSSPSDVQPVLDSVAENAARICEAQFVDIVIVDEGRLRFCASVGELARPATVETFTLDRSTIMGRSVVDQEPVHIDDLQEAGDEFALGRQGALQYGHRSTLAVPLVRKGRALGTIMVRRTEVRPFEQKHIALLQTFADQAAIAIENVRLFNAEQQRTHELAESLAGQTATSEILRVISQSPTDARPVFDSIVRTAARLLRCDLVFVHLCDGATFSPVALASPEGPIADLGPTNLPIDWNINFPSRAIVDREMLHVPDWSRADLPAFERDIHQIFAVNSALYLPLLREGECIGLLTLVGKRANMFGAAEIARAESFRDQALIAMENARLFNETKEALEQQTATSEVLRIISSSTGDLSPVFQSMLENATRLCGANFGVLSLMDGDSVRIVAMHNMPPVFAERFQREPIVRAGPLAPISRLVASKDTVHIADLAQDESYREGDPPVVALVDNAGVRSILVIPMLKESDLVGALSIYSREARPFSDKQIDLVRNFAAQAVIAIENARLLNELRQRTDDLTESLEQQTATSEVLKVISRSTFDLDTVLTTLVKSARELCDAANAAVFLRDGEVVRLRAESGCTPEFADFLTRNPIRPGRNTFTGRVMLTGDIVHLADVLADPDYNFGASPQLGNFRSALGVPLLRDGRVEGVFSLGRPEPNAFSLRQIELVKAFADQAVIAIENTRLLNELRQRTDDLTESLEQQTATSEVLQVISGSPGDLQPVFAKMLENAVRICDAKFGNIYRWDGEALHLAATHKTPPAFAEARRYSLAKRPDPKTVTGRMLATRSVVHVADAAEQEGYANRSDSAAVAAVELGRVRTILAVPMLKEDKLIGSFTVYRQEVRPFSDKQIALVTSFAAQAVIAIENARLLTELRQRTDELGRSVGELRALGEVSQAVNSTLDLETVLETIVAKAVQLSSTDAGAIYVFAEADREFRLRATYGMDSELIEALKNARVGFGEPNIALMLADREPVQVADLAKEGSSDVDRIVVRGGYRSRLTAPLFRGDDIVGLLVVRRCAPGAFPKSTVDLVKTFAAQSAVAIQNARLFENVETRTRELANSLQDLRTAQDRLIQTEKLASLGQLTAGIAHEIKNPLNFVNNFSALSAELIDELQEILQDVPVDEEKRAEVTELTHMLRGNLEKVVQHGKRADSIVKNMLLHSRQGSAEHQPTDINALVEESLNLAYHGARAEKQGFNITIEKSLDPAAGKAELFPQEITRVLLNLISNGFYAANKRKAQGDGGFAPTLKAATKNLGDRVEIRIRDNGTGIPPEVKDKMFNPFFTTKPAGEGTGLGLSLSYDIIVKQHSGSIEVETEPGAFTEFRIVLPRVSGAAKTGGKA